jgi:hypothetical protein
MAELELSSRIFPVAPAPQLVMAVRESCCKWSNEFERASDWIWFNPLAKNGKWMYYLGGFVVGHRDKSESRRCSSHQDTCEVNRLDPIEAIWLIIIIT